MMMYGPDGDGWGEIVPVVEAVADRATVERVAMAIYKADGGVIGPPVHLEYMQQARAALRALGYTIQEGT